MSRRIDHDGPMLRAARAADAGAIARLCLRETCRHVRADCTPDGLRQLLAGMVARAVQARLDEGGYRYWVAMQEGSIAGVAALRGANHLYHLFVASERQGSGIGSALLRQVVAAAAGDHVSVNSSTFARAFYRRQGFRDAGGAWSANGVRCWPMRLERMA